MEKPVVGSWSYQTAVPIAHGDTDSALASVASMAAVCSYQSAGSHCWPARGQGVGEADKPTFLSLHTHAASTSV